MQTPLSSNSLSPLPIRLSVRDTRSSFLDTTSFETYFVSEKDTISPDVSPSRKYSIRTPLTPIAIKRSNTKNLPKFQRSRAKTPRLNDCTRLQDASFLWASSTPPSTPTISRSVTPPPTAKQLQLSPPSPPRPYRSYRDEGFLESLSDRLLMPKF